MPDDVAPAEPDADAPDPGADAPDAPATPRPDEPADLAREVPSVVATGCLFLASLLLALVVAPTYAAQHLQAFQDPQSLANPIIYLVIVLAFTAVLLLIAKRGMGRLIQGIVLVAVLFTVQYVAWPLLRLVTGDPWATILSIALALGLGALLYVYPEWYVVDTVGVAVASGAAALFGISFGILPSLALLVAFAVYDAIAVYRTKHMLDLADSVMELRLPIMLVVPKGRGYSFLRERRRFRDADAGETPERGEREAMFMGLGDIVIPGVLVISAATYLPDTAATWLGLHGPTTVALGTLVGALAGFGLLMTFVLKGRPQAGLPSLNGGAILGFLVALLAVYGSLAPILP